MRKLIFALFICVMMFQLWAQGNYYIYLQSDDGKRFYAKTGAKVFESSPNGYLVISDLTGPVSEFVIGFPDQPGTEWKFNCPTGEIDQAYILRPGNKNKPVEISILKQGKNITGTKLLTVPQKQSVNQEKKVTGIVSNDAFATMLALAVNDPTIRQQPVIISKPAEPEKTAVAAISKQPEVKKEEKPQSKTDSTLIVKDSKKDSAKTSIAISNKQPEAKKEDKTQPKTDSAVIVKDSKKDSAKTSVAIADKQPDTKKEDKAPTTIDSNAIVTPVKKDAPNAALVAMDKKPQVKKEEQIIEKTDSNSIVKTTVPETNQDSTMAKAKAPTTTAQPGTWVPVEKRLSTIVRSSNIKRTLQRKSNEGVELIYVDELTDGTKDTIRILIPASK